MAHDGAREACRIRLLVDFINRLFQSMRQAFNEFLIGVLGELAKVEIWQQLGKALGKRERLGRVAAAGKRG